MRAIGTCSTHPSREARLRCRSCRTWICERCVQVIAGHIYCSRSCRVADLRSRLGARLREVALTVVHPAWAMVVVTGAAALLLTAIGTRIATLVELSTPEPVVVTSEPSPTPTPIPLTGELIRQGRSWRLTITGPPRAAVLVAAGADALRVVELDGDGRATVDGLRLDREAPEVRLLPLPARAAVISGRPTATPEPATVSPTATPPATATPAPTTPTATPRPRRSYPGAPPILHHVHDAGPRIALSFDGGSKSGGAAEVLRVLTAAGLKVTLFLTGEFIEREPALVRQAVLDGHEVGNHTFTHLHLTTYETNRNHYTLGALDRSAFEDQLRRTEEAFRTATGKPMAPLWRAPYGEENSELRWWALEMGYLHVRWSSLEGKSLDSRDWVKDEHSSLYQEPDQMMDRLLRFPQLRGGIVLMHLASDREQHPAVRLPYFIAELAQRDIEPVRVSDLLETSPTWRRWLAKARANHQRVWGE